MSREIVALETAEIEAHVDLAAAAGADVVEQCGLVGRRLGNGFVMAATKLDVLAINRASGVGLTEVPSDEDLRELIDAFRDIGSPRYFVQVPPTDEARDVPERLERLGLRHYNNWMRLRRDLGDLPLPPDSSLRVERIGTGEAGTFAAIVAKAFGFPPTLEPYAGCVVGRLGWHHYLAYDGDVAVGCAAMFIVGDATWFGFAATLEEARGRGAQTALIVRRLEDAAREGCTWVSVETAEQTEDHEAPSFRNLTRLGFSVSYKRPNYLWSRADDKS